MPIKTTDQKVLDALTATGWKRTIAAHQLGITPRALAERLKRLKANGYEIPDSPYTGIPFDKVDHFAPPAGFTAKAVSTYHGPDGEVKGQWVKSSIDEAQQRALIEQAVAVLCERIPRVKATAAPKRTHEKLCNLYTITDAHLGMYSWAPETGADWDLAIAERIIGGCFEQMMLAAPPAELGIVNQMGDFLHTDSFKALTPASGHLLDADSRYQKIVEVAVRVLRRMVALALMRHERVTIQFLDANHDPVGETWLRVLFAALYENEPRVTVVTSPSPYTAIRHGRTMLTFHHGHGAKKEKLPLLFAARYPEMWGGTDHRYCHTGHYHHIDEKEHAGMIVTQHPTLAAMDAYAARGGWDSRRAAQAITYHSEHGEVARSVVRPEMLAA